MVNDGFCCCCEKVARQIILKCVCLWCSHSGSVPLLVGANRTNGSSESGMWLSHARCTFQFVLNFVDQRMHGAQLEKQDTSSLVGSPCHRPDSGWQFERSFLQFFVHFCNFSFIFLQSGMPWLKHHLDCCWQVRWLKDPAVDNLGQLSGSLAAKKFEVDAGNRVGNAQGKQNGQ